jgi:hypothetical protein
MHPFSYGETSARRKPCGAMWNTRNIKDLGREGLPDRFLLADDKEICGRLSPEV